MALLGSSIFGIQGRFACPFSQNFDCPKLRIKPITLNTFEKAWGYIGKINLVSRALLNAAARAPKFIHLAGENFPHQVKNVVTHLKLFSIVSVPLSLLSLKATSEKLLKSFFLNDKEGMALAALSFTILAADTFDSITTFVNAALSLASVGPIESLAATGLPVAYLLVSLGTISRTIQIAKSFNLHQAIGKEMDVQSKASLKDFLENKLGLKEIDQFLASIGDKPANEATLKQIETIRERKKAALLRAASPEVYQNLETLFEWTKTSSLQNFTEDEAERVFHKLEEIQHQLQKKMEVNLLGLLANFIGLSSLILVSLGTGGILTFLLTALGFATRLLAVAYNDLV